MIRQRPTIYKYIDDIVQIVSTSGVGVQSRYLLTGLLETGEYQIRQLGAAVKHIDYTTVSVPPPHGANWQEGDFIIKPIDGFGDSNLLRQLLVTEKPDAVLIFTDPRFFIWLWEMEEELHQICPLVYWHVWDNEPYPEFNKVLYESTDLLNCHSYLTYEMVSKRFPEKTNFIPHALPPELFRPLDPVKVRELKKQIISPARVDDFVCIWVNRNAKRKRANDVLESWKLFLDKLEAKYGHRNATIIMHTDPFDVQGSNLVSTAEMLKIQKNVFYSKERLEFEQMAILYNISDCCMNISLNEGFGLSTLEAMQCGKPIIALKTGGLTRQVVDHRDGSENGVALDVEMRTLVGSQGVSYIYEDLNSNNSTAEGLMKLYEMGPAVRAQLGEKARQYALSEFNLEKTIAEWYKTLSSTIETWKSDRSKIYTPWTCKTL